MKRRTGMASGLIALALLAAVAVAPLSSSAATPAAGTGTGVGVRLLDIPVATQSDPRARSYIIDNLVPGTTIQRRIQVTNDMDTPQSVHVYAAAARISGDSFVGETGTTPNELTSWISAAQPQLTVAPRQSVDDLITIAVPAGATEGERYAAIWAEVRSTSTDASGASIIGASRAGVRVYLSVAPGNGPPSSFTISSITARRDAAGTPSVLAAVENTGARAIDLSGTLSLSGGAGGLSAGPFAADRTITLAPHTKGTVTIPLAASLPRGPWNAKLTLTSGLLSHSSSARITFPAAGLRDTVTAPHAPILLWIAVGAAIVVIALGIVLALRTVRRRRLR